MPDLYIDFETRSCTDIKRGAYLYSTCPSTEMLCLGWAFGDEPVEILVSKALPQSIIEHVQSGGIVKAFNASFEWHVWNHTCSRYGWPELPLEQTVCIQAQARIHRLDGNLDSVGKFLGLGGKDEEGKESLKKFFKPLKYIDDKPSWYWNPDEFRKMLRYCVRDVDLMREIEKRLFPWPKGELDVYHLNERINRRGVLIDAGLCKAALEEWEILSTQARQDMILLSGGVIKGPHNHKETLKYFQSKYPEKGLTSTTQLKPSEFEGDDKELIILRKTFAKNSISKFQKLLDMQCPDGRYRGAHKYYGAGPGRMSGYGAQLQNLPQPKNSFEKVCEARYYLKNRDTAQRPDFLRYAVADCIRGALIAPPGKTITAIDLSGIELRVLAWLAGAHEKLDLIRQDKNLYKLMAAQIYKMLADDVQKDTTEYKVGKAGELSLGFQGGIGALSKSLDKEQIVLDEAIKRKIVKDYRATPYNKPIVDYWAVSQRAAISAVRQPSSLVDAGSKVKYIALGNWLICRLPSGRPLFYPYPKIKVQSWYCKIDEDGEEIHKAFFRDPGAPWEKTSEGEVVVFRMLKSKGVFDTAAYGGFLAQNATQATARDLLINGLHFIENCDNMDTIFTVHDETVVESYEDVLQQLLEAVKNAPDWAKGIPVKAEGWTGEFYRK